jgi:hypothetical protein
MEKINFNDLPSTDTPINSSNLNQLQKNVENAINGIIESGKWTPTIGVLDETAPTVTYEIQRGYYIKIGRMVYVEFKIRGKITSLNGTNNYACIEGLPYSYHNNCSLGQQAIGIGNLYHLTYNPDNPVFTPYGYKIRIQNTNGAAAASLMVTDTSYFDVGGSGCYMTE